MRDSIDVSLLTIKVSLHGGQVTSWRNEQGEELLFTSTKVQFLPIPYVLSMRMT